MRLALAATTPAMFAGEMRSERLFEPEIKTGLYKHPARIEELWNGDLYVVYYGGEGENATATGVFDLRLKEGSSQWTPPARIAHVSRDKAETWSDAFPLVSEEELMVCNKPILLHKGNYLLPLYFEGGHNAEFTANDSSGLFPHYDVKRKEWTGHIRSRCHCARESN